MNKIVCLDAGHGGNDPGATGYGRKEKDLCLDRVLSMRDLFEQKYEGVSVVLTRSTDVFLELFERVQVANNAGADAFISDHKNAFNGSTRGFESFVWNGGVVASTRHLQSLIHHKVVVALSRYNVPDRGRKEANFSVLRNANMSALLLEEAFIDNTVDNNLMRQEAFKEAYCHAVVEGVAEHLGLKKKKSSSTTPYEEAEQLQSKTKQTTNNLANIQFTLNGRYKVNIAVDNMFGPETKSALVRALQTELNKQFNRGLMIDGKFGPKTKAACVTIREGARGNITWILQAILFCHGYSVGIIDGVFGTKTKEAVKAFQRDKKLQDDGVAGQKTFQMLFE